MKYSVVKFIPDQIADEKINVGIIVLNLLDGSVHFHPRKNWDRVYNFAPNNSVVDTILRPWLHKVSLTKTESELESLISMMNNGIYSPLFFTELRIYLLDDIDKVFESLEKIYFK